MCESVPLPSLPLSSCRHLPDTDITFPDNIVSISDGESCRSVTVPAHKVIQCRDSAAQNAPSRLVVVAVPCEESDVTDTRPRDAPIGNNTVAYLGEEGCDGAGGATEHVSDGSGAGFAVPHGQDDICLGAGSTPEYIAVGRSAELEAAELKTAAIEYAVYGQGLYLSAVLLVEEA